MQNIKVGNRSARDACLIGGISPDNRGLMPLIIGSGKEKFVSNLFETD